MDNRKHPHCWISPDDALDDLNVFTSFGEVDKPFPTTNCFSVWGRGRPRPLVSEIVLPTEEVANISPLKPTVKSKGRGRLLLLEEEVLNTTSSIIKEQLKSKKEKVSLKEIEDTYGKKKLNNAIQPTTNNMTLKELEQHYCKPTTFESNNLFSPNDFPEL